LLSVIFLDEASVGDLLLFVVAIDEILDDRARLQHLSARQSHSSVRLPKTYLPQRQSSVWVMESRQATIWVELDVFFLLDFRELQWVCLIWKPERFEDHGHLEWIGSSPVSPELEGFERHAGGEQSESHGCWKCVRIDAQWLQNG